MNYQWHYDKLIETRKLRSLSGGVYYEKHHILMKSMGGNDDEENIVALTAREHFLAHWLLWRIHRNSSTAYAFSSFVHLFTGHNHENRPKITSSRGYAEAREVYAKVHSERMTGVLNSNRSKKVLQYDIARNFIREWPSAAEAHRQLSISHITSCCRGERLIAGGFLWKYENAELKKSKQYKKREKSEKTKIVISDSHRKKISAMCKGRKHYNDGVKGYYMKPEDFIIRNIDINSLTPGRLMKNKQL